MKKNILNPWKDDFDLNVSVDEFVDIPYEKYKSILKMNPDDLKVKFKEAVPNIKQVPDLKQNLKQPSKVKDSEVCIGKVGPIFTFNDDEQLMACENRIIDIEDRLKASKLASMKRFKSIEHSIDQWYDQVKIDMAILLKKIESLNTSDHIMQDCLYIRQLEKELLQELTLKDKLKHSQKNSKILRLDSLD